MNWSRCAILARCNGDRSRAFQYCMNVATEYPNLTREYSELALSFAGHLVERLEAIRAWR